MPTSPSEPTLDTAETAPIDASPSELAAAKLRHRTGRNDPCPCGSGKKYKKCCLSEDEDLARKAVIQAQRQESAEPAQEGLETDELPQGETQPQSPETQERPIALNELSPETEAKLDAVWSRFESLEKPTTEQMDEVLRDLFDLPADATEWGQLLQQFSLKGHADLVGVFRRIAATVPHTGKTDMPFFYWAAAEVFAGRGEKELLSEVIAGFCRLDLESYDADALSHLENVLLAAEVEGPTLALAEHFLPIERADTGLMPHAVPSRCQLIFELRVGEAISRETTDQDPQRLAQEFIRGIDDGVGFDTAQVAAEIVRGAARKSVWIPADFDLVNEELRQNTQAWQDSLRLFGNLVRVAQEAWRLEKRPPASGLRGLLKLLESVYDWDEYRRGRKKKKRRKNLLEFLRPAELDGRIGQACHDLVGCDLSRVRLQFRAHEVLTAFAARHQLISASDADKVQTELTRLWHRFEE